MRAIVASFVTAVITITGAAAALVWQAHREKVPDPPPPPPAPQWNVGCAPQGQPCAVSITVANERRRVVVAIGTTRQGHRTARVVVNNTLQAKPSNGANLGPVLVAGIRLDDGATYGANCGGPRHRLPVTGCEIQAGHLSEFVQSLARARTLYVLAADDTETPVDARGFADAWQLMQQRADAAR